MQLNQCLFQTRYLSKEQSWMLEAIFNKEQLGKYVTEKVITDQVIETLFEERDLTFYLFRKKGDAHLASVDSELFRIHFCPKPQPIRGKALLMYSISTLEEAVEKSYAKVPNNDGIIECHIPSSPAGFKIKKTLEELGIFFSTIWKSNDSTPRIFTESCVWKGEKNIDAFLNSFA
jgi:hypothetical protein